MEARSLGFYEWAGRTIKRHRAEIRAHLGFRECTVVDAEKILAEQIAGRLSPDVRARLLSLVAVADTDVDDADPNVLALIKAATGNVSLSSMLTEISRLEAVRAIGLPAGLFAHRVLSTCGTGPG